MKDAGGRGRDRALTVWDRVLRWVPPAIRPSVKADLTAAILFGVFAGLTVPFVPVMGRRLGASPLEVSLLVAAPSIGLLGSLWWANAIHRTPSLHMIIRTQVAGRGLLLLLPLVHAPEPYVGLILLQYTVTSIGSLAYAQVIREAYPQEVRARIVAFVRAWMALVWAVTAFVGGRVLQEVPFQWVFAAAALFGIISPFMLKQMRVSDTGQAPSTLTDTWHLLRTDRPFLRFLAGFFVFGFGVWLMAPVIPILLVDVLHASNFQVGLLGATTSATAIVAYYYWGRLMDRRPATHAVVPVFVVGTMTPLIYLVATTPWMALAAGVTDGLTSAGIDLGWLQGVFQYAPIGQIRHYVAIYNTLVGVRGVIAPILSGLLLPVVGSKVILTVSALCTLTGAALMRRAQGARETAR
jgi:hypothetical protein